MVNNLNATLSENTQIQRHLQTGRKIINNHEDSGGLGSITRLNSTVLRNQAIQQNLQGSLSLLQAQDGMFKVIGNILDRSAELKTKFDSTMYNKHEKAYYDDEFTELQNELRQIAQSKWNGISLFSTQDSKTLFGPAVDGQTINQESSDDGSGNTLALSRWGIYHLEPPFPPPPTGGVDFLAITITDESEGGGGGYTTSSGGSGPSNISADQANWENFLSGNNPAGVEVTAEIACVVTVRNGGTVPDGNVVPGGDGNLDSDVGIVYRSSDFDGSGSLDSGETAGRINAGSAELQDINNQARYLKNALDDATKKGVPKAMAIFVDDSGSLKFSHVENGLDEFFNLVSADPRYSQMVTPDPSLNSGGFIRGMWQAPAEDWIAQSQKALSELMKVDSNFQSAITAPELEPTYELDDYSIEDFEGFMDSLTTARAQNGAEQSRIKHELDELQTKQVGLEQAVERADGLDYSLAMARYSKSRDQLHLTASLVSAAREMETVLYTDFLNE